MVIKEKFPVISYNNYKQQVVEGFTINKSNKKWVAVVLLDTSFGSKLKLYVWKKKDGSWKIDLVVDPVIFDT